MGPGLRDCRWDAEAGHTTVPRAVWSNLATSWGKLDINHPLCSPPSPCPAVTPLPGSVPVQQPASPALPAAWGQPVLRHRGSFSWGRPSAPDGPWCPITQGVILHPSGAVPAGEVSPSPHAPSHPGCTGQTDGAEPGGNTHPGKCCPAPSFPPALSKPRLLGGEGLPSQTATVARPNMGREGWLSLPGLQDVPVLHPHGTGLWQSREGALLLRAAHSTDQSPAAPARVRGASPIPPSTTFACAPGESIRHSRGTQHPESHGG